MCERVWRIAQVCAKKQGLAAGSRGWLVATSRQIDAHVPSMPESEASRQLFTIGQKSQAGQAVCLRLELATQPNRKVKSPENKIRESFQKEFWEKNPRENKIDSSTIFT